MPGIHSRCLEASPFKIASSPSGLQVFVLFNALGSHSYGAFRGGRSGLCPCSVAYPRWATCPFDCLICCTGPRPRHRLRKSSCGQPLAGALSRHATPSMSESSVTWLGGFKRAKCCAGLCRSDSTPSGVSTPVQVCAAQGEKRRKEGFWGDSVLAFYTR